MSIRVLTPWMVGIALVVFSAAGRLVPHPANFVPVAAAALFAGFFFKHRASALAVPLTAMGISDLALGGYDWRIMVVVYAALALPVALRPFLRTLSVRRVVVCSLVGSVVFFLASNGAVWAFSPMYAPTVAGLAASYIAALPFLAYTLAGDLVWCSVFFGGYAIFTSNVGQRARSRIAAKLSATEFAGA